jgi:hypothetical protein
MADRLLSSMRYEFGGHRERGPGQAPTDNVVAGEAGTNRVNGQSNVEYCWTLLDDTSYKDEGSTRQGSGRWQGSDSGRW